MWCEDATKLTKSRWAFIRIDQEDFERYRFKSIEELALTLKDYGNLYVKSQKLKWWSPFVYTP